MNVVAIVNVQGSDMNWYLTCWTKYNDTESYNLYSLQKFPEISRKVYILVK